MRLYRVLATASATLLLAAAPGLAADAPYQIVVSRDQQSLVVYDGDTVVATSRVSTGKKGHTTPTGIFSILEKRRHHRSNIYSNAPMPFMQRLTWSGIALHASNHVPNHPASHGCIRMPNSFAETLYRMTDRGLHVIVSGRQVTPQEVVHPLLFQPHVAPPPLLSDAQLRPAMSSGAAGLVEVAMTEPAPGTSANPRADAPPIRILITRRDAADGIRDLQGALAGLGYLPGPIDGHAGPQTIDAVKAFQTADGQEADGRISPELVAAVYAKAGKGLPPNGRLLVRRNFKPLFEADVTIDRPDMALGTLFLQFQDVDTAGTRGKWFAVALENTLSAATKARLGITTDSDPTAFNAVQRTLGRITIAEDVRRKVEEALVEGSSLTVSDAGTTAETGLGTDFITVTQVAPRGR
ncbi:L,D-transpeptidase family protein [Ensifer soli]|uniref:L,D-transpeptidase family protein n=1 Tax=Ciceribacter sp. sgz301302 TaxID=3342379 RepID=UPI0035B893E4